ncbi:MAG: C39 family peptidase [Anaerolineales bacterium]|nr:C39 family peptidase [Anaerolineales bacterium]
MAEMKTYSQQDPAWKNTLLGFDKESTIGSYGCLLTCMTMISSVYGFNETPVTVNDKLKAVNGFQSAYVIPALLPSALPGIKYRNYIICSNQPAPLAEIDATLAAGKPVIIEVDYSPKAGLQNHWIVLYAKRGDDYLIRDPYPYPPESKEVTLASRYGFAGSPAQVIQAALWLDGPAGAITAPPPKPPQLDTGVYASFKVYATSEDLAIRSQTLVSNETLLKRVPLNTEFTVLEADAVAKAKIGQMNQWLAVKAPDGTTGYTAAWYVSLTKQTPAAAAAPAKATAAVAATAPTASAAPVAPAAPKVTAPSVVVKTTTEGVALRSKPETSDATLIKRLPLGSELKVFESASEAQRKIGVMYEWLQVQDVTGTAGVVAAWYVARSGQPALGANNQTPTTSPSFAVGMEAAPVLLRVSEDGLALRSAPVISADTLVKRLPIGSELFAIESPEFAGPKIGKVGEWIHVRDVTGEEGYVAAWFVDERPADPAPVVGPTDS